MDNWMKLIGWLLVGLIGANLINEVLYQLIPLPEQGISLAKAYIPAIGGAIFGGYCAYRGVRGFKKD